LPLPGTYAAFLHHNNLVGTAHCLRRVFPAYRDGYIEQDQAPAAIAIAHKLSQVEIARFASRCLLLVSGLANRNKTKVIVK